MGAVDVPAFALPIGGEDERTLAGPDQNAYLHAKSLPRAAMNAAKERPV
jgi:hypothetical protein